MNPTPRAILYLDIDDTLVRHVPKGPHAAPDAADLFAWAPGTFQARWRTRWFRDAIMLVDPAQALA